jgi:hypothetical protein
MKVWIWKSVVGTCSVLLLAFTAVTAVQAQDGPGEISVDDCGSCHEAVQIQWAGSTHARALSDPIFQEAWLAQGNSPDCLTCHTTGFNPVTKHYEQEGIACVTCHSPIAEEHPLQLMPTNPSSRLCGECHLDTYEEWEMSGHGQKELACIRCHNPHSTNLKKSDAQAVCQACHRSEVHFFSFTMHAQEGILCTDCHVRVSPTTLGEGHGQRLHTFRVDLKTCMTCHGDNMHYPTDKALGASRGEQAFRTGNSLAVVEELAVFTGGAPVSMEPNPVGPWGFALIAILIGMGAGVICAPWLDKWYRAHR